MKNWTPYKVDTRRLLAVGMCLGVVSCWAATTAIAKHSYGRRHATHRLVIRARTTQQQDVAYRFAQCMRQHGAEQPDPAHVPGRPGLTLDITDSGPNVVAARSACQPILNELTEAKVRAIGPAGIEARRQEAQRYVSCMRAHGVELGEPQAPLYEVGPLLDQADRETSKADAPKLQQAKAACLSLDPANRP